MSPSQHHPVYGAQSALAPPAPAGGPASPPNQHLQQYNIGSSVNVTSPPSYPSTNDRNLLSTQWNRAGRLASKSCENLSNQISNRVSTITTYGIVKPTNLVTKKSVQALNQTAALCDRISDKFDTVITSIDGGVFSGDERDLYIYDDLSQTSISTSPPTGAVQDRKASNHRNANSDKGSNFFSKVWLYSNSRLPIHLPPFKIYMDTYRLLCLAANYSERAYEPASPSTAETHIPADWKSGTKAMVLKSLPIDDMNTIVFAIRGSQTFMDWAVNYRSEPSSPKGFLDDTGNACHAGFLYVARKMVKPVADRLRVLLQENPARSNASLLITGHSAGGAVAALLFAHMMSLTIQSDLNYLTGFFKRVHCITFGAPPVSLLPLKRSNDTQHRKSLFFSFINEGDPVPRADRDVVKSLLRLYSSPSPNLKSTTTSMPEYPIVPGSLSPAGRLVVLRNKPGSHTVDGEEIIEAVTVEDDMFRTVVYGDPMKHMMKLYRRRVEILATRAITGADW
ncbi:alpha/beta-hydrolase [Periconia macrospinosa]|uniref:Alpha/beta-hydrolase n=1 Tax=Periconia macrospinosa TaxID=97972 RepID=A0A2V1E7E9_9PLEO|nr:alpha/beta-hydrolase [Periconia macrospinosa]